MIKSLRIILFYLFIIFSLFGCKDKNPNIIDDFENHLGSREKLLRNIFDKDINDSQADSLLIDLNFSTTTFLLEKNRDYPNYTLPDLEKFLINKNEIKYFRTILKKITFLDHTISFFIDFILSELIFFFIIFMISKTATSAKIIEAYKYFSGLLFFIVLGIITSFIWDFGYYFSPNNEEKNISNKIEALNMTFIEELEKLKSIE